MSLLYSAGAANYIGVVDIAAATAWYIDKLCLRKVDVELDDGEGCVALGFDKDDYALCLGPPGRPTDEFTPISVSALPDALPMNSHPCSTLPA